MPRQVIYKQLAQRKLKTTGVSVLYSVPNINTTAYIHTIIATNTDTGTSRTYSIYFNPNSSTAVAGDQNTIFSNELLQSSTHDVHTFLGESALVLDKAGASILASAGTADTIVVSIFGKEVIET